jgi:hypothetical protein
MFPSNPKEIALPKIIFYPLTIDELISNDYQEEKKDEHQGDSWIRSHASGCSYHLRN